ncbi:MAG: DUF427 domain-containing protein [Rhodomicrobiaceae bacterium]
MAAEPANPAPGFRKRPEHRVDLEAGPARLRVVFAGQTIADTVTAITVKETNYAPVHYIPLTDVKADLLNPGSHTSYCPFKGTARYWSIEANGERVENAVWAYDEPYDEVAALKGHVAFYPDGGAQILVD